jgi:hypothetical protein
MPFREHVDVPASGFQCTVTQMNGELCQIVCDASTNPPWGAAEGLVQWIADRYGRYMRHTDSGDMRTWAWSRPDDYFEAERVPYDLANPFLRVTASVGAGRGRLRLEYAVHFERSTLRPPKAP